MPSLPRIITVDPTGNVARIVRAAIDLSEYLCRQIDVPTGEEAIDEMKLTQSNLLISALNLEDMRAFDLAEQARQIKEDVAIIILADEDDPEMDSETQREYGFVYLQRPLDFQKFGNVMFAGMKGEDIFAALTRQAVPASGGTEDMGPVPPMDVNKAQEIIDRLVSELFAMSILLIDRVGNVLLERGPSANYIDRNALTAALVASMRTTIDMKDIVGGDATTLQFYDGDQRDVYTLSVGLHHMLCIAFDGEKGQREFGAVNRYGRKAAMDLIALLGAEAFFVRRTAVAPVQEVEENELPRRRRSGQTMMAPAIPVEQDKPLARAEGFEVEASGNDLEKVELEAISDDLFDASFLNDLDNMDLSNADDLFSLDNLGNVASGLKSQRTLSEEEAMQLGILGNNLDND
ncbi:MAG: hypothetical protein AAF787_07010 [Chloroflexota bacterium]